MKNKGANTAALQLATSKLVDAIKLGDAGDVSANLEQCLQVLTTANNVQVDEFLLAVFRLSELDDLDKATYAITLCGFLVELSYPSHALVAPIINLFDELLDTSHPFFVLFNNQLPSLKEGEGGGELFEALLTNQVLVNDEVRRAVWSINRFYTAAVSVFSIDARNHGRAKNKLAQKIATISNFCEGAYWLNHLLNTFFDEPIIVIDIDRNIGFEGRMSGIGDNYQLQHLLMSLPDINENVELTAEQLKTLTGTGEQVLDVELESKWNMYMHTVTQQEGWTKLINSDDMSVAMSYRDYWIWSEGTPADILEHNGRRVILLGKSAYKRSSKIQRSFKNMKAKIQVDNMLTDAEIRAWLNL